MSESLFKCILEQAKKDAMYGEGRYDAELLEFIASDEFDEYALHANVDGDSFSLELTDLIRRRI